MASLDVEALFTNIPLEETIDICVEQVFKTEDKVEGLGREDFRLMLSLATKESFISFNGCFLQANRRCRNGFTSWTPLRQHLPLLS